MTCPRIRVLLALLFLLACASCGNQKPADNGHPAPASFSAETLKIPDRGMRKIRGQVVYMPIYSNIPYTEKKHYDLSAFLAIHNTDLKYQIKILKVILFNTEGMVVRHFISEERLLGSLATAIFTIPRQDQSGAGANFLVEWEADQPVSEPLIESIMKDLSGNLGISFTSLGRVIREIQ